MSDASITVEEVNLTIEGVKGLLDTYYELICTDYRDNFDDHLDAVQDAINSQDPGALDDLVFGEGWFVETEDESVEYALDELAKKVCRQFGVDEEDAEQFVEEHETEIKDEIYDRSTSRPVDEMLRYTKHPVCFYDTGVEILFEHDNEALLAANLVLIKDVLNIRTDAYDGKLALMLAQAWNGGRLVVYFREDVRRLLKIGEMTTIHFKNPAVAIIDTCDGSGDDTSLPGHEFSLTLKVENIFIDRTIKYNYTYSVCGMDSSWCDCTRVSFSQTGDAPQVTKSTLHMERDVEAVYNLTFRNGGCTEGDRDMRRHRGVYYSNDYPAGTRCPHCGTYWPD